MINLSSRALSAEETAVLSKGLSFVPSKHTDPFMTKIELFKFFRSVKLRAFFTTNPAPPAPPREPTAPQDNSPKSHFRPKSTFMPHVLNPSVQTFCRLVDQDVSKQLEKPQHFYPNLSHSERAALRTLSEDDTIVIKNADKGGGIVLQDKEAYRNEILRQLGDKEFYAPLMCDPTGRFFNSIKRTLSTGRTENYITKNEHEFLLQQHPVRPVFYTLPKIHKKCDITVPGRPIVAGCQSLTEGISQYVDWYIKPIVWSLPSYLRDTSDFLSKLMNVNVSNDDFLCTMDITSLYTNIPHDLGLSALDHYLKSRDVDEPPSSFLWDLAHIVLNMNYFKYENSFYHQVKGTAMGSPFAPNYANLFMGKFEEDFVYSSKNSFLQCLKCYFRFIDDIFFVFKGTEEQLHNFHDFLNSRLDSIHFTLEYDKSSISFLDVNVSRSTGPVLQTSVFRKPTDRNNFLHSKSYHPPSMKKSLPYSQFLRMRRICSTADDFESQAKIIYERFLSKGYDRENLDSCLDRARNMERESLLEKKDVKSDNRIVLSSTFSPLSSDVKATVKRHWHILSSDSQIGHSFQDPPLFAFKRFPNVRDSLVRADSFTPPTNWLTNLDPGNYPCKNCVNCNAMIKGNAFLHPRTGRSFSVRGRITCRTTFVVYLLKCPCGFGYVGKTKRELRIRINEHKSNIRNHDIKSPVARHFNECGHDVCTLRFQGIELVKPLKRGGDRERLLLQREAYWIFTLQTVQPNGLNEELTLTSFL